jgi:type I restriction enzyme M protein
MAELSEEHGSDEGVLNDVSSKADAELAYTQAVVAIWNEEDKPACTAYSALIDAADGYASHLRTLSDKYHLSALKNPKGKITLKVVKDRLAQLSTGEEYDALADYVSTDKRQKDATKKAGELFAAVESIFVNRLSGNPLPENLHDLQAAVRFLKLLDQQSILKAEIKEIEAALDQLAYDQYQKLTEAEIQTLVVDDKWLTSLAAAVQGELDRVSQTLTSRIRLLADRYAAPLQQILDEVAALGARVDGHLKKMETIPPGVLSLVKASA